MNCASRTNRIPVHDFLKPGIEELCQLLPGFLARPILRLSQRKGWLGRVYFGMEINSTSIGGYLRFLVLAKLRRLRPYGHRYKQEQAQIEFWLALIAQAARLSAGLALEVAECARLIKGYGDTHARGLANYRHHRGARNQAGAGRRRPAGTVRPTPSPAPAPPRWSIRMGESLGKCLAELDGQTAFGWRRNSSPSSGSVVSISPVE